MSYLFSANIEVISEFNYSQTETIVPKKPLTIHKKSVIIKKKRVKKVVKKKIIVKNKNLKKSKQVKKNIKQTIKDKKIVKKRVKKVMNKSIKPKLVIIIDDISHKYQLNYIKSLPFKVTPSIFPPSKMNMHSNKLAKGLKHFMVHLPLQSDSRAMNRMHKTLFITDSKIKIKNRVLEIKKLFPNVKYINNHTGSVFTKNYKKSKELYSYLLKNGIKFVDSRTTQKTVFPKLAKEFKQKYYKNDLFIDNKIDTNAIIKKIKFAIKLAKKRGYAVIIGHPHHQTFKALKLSEKYLKNINVIYIDEL